MTPTIIFTKLEHKINDIKSYLRVEEEDLELSYSDEKK
jgi:hypothetical protein